MTFKEPQRIELPMRHESFLMRHSVPGGVPKLKIYPDRILQREIGKGMLNETRVGIIFSM